MLQKFTELYTFTLPDAQIHNLRLFQATNYLLVEEDKL